MEEDDTLLKIICQSCKGFVTCKGRSGEPLYMSFLHDGLSNISLYPEELDQDIIYFLWPTRKKIKRLYHKLLKEVHGYHKHVRCPNLKENHFEVLRSAMAFNMFDL